jgi:hypothetical protein
VRVAARQLRGAEGGGGETEEAVSEERVLPTPELGEQQARGPEAPDPNRADAGLHDERERSEAAAAAVHGGDTAELAAAFAADGVPTTVRELTPFAMRRAIERAKRKPKPHRPAARLHRWAGAAVEDSAGTLYTIARDGSLRRAAPKMTKDERRAARRAAKGATTP